MTQEEILSRRKQAEDEFDKLETQKQQIEARQAELRGQYQLLNEQLAALESPKEKTKEKQEASPKADTLDVTNVKGA